MNDRLFYMRAIFGSESEMCIFHPIAEPIIVPRDLFTQIGCNVTTQCSANNAMTIEWSTRRTSIDFTNSTTRSAWTIDYGNGTQTAFLSFTNIGFADQNEYSCIIIFSSEEFSINTIRVIVDLEPIIMSPIQDYTLNNTMVGDTITIGCVIKTCGIPNNVSFLDEQDESQQSFSRNDDGAFNWNPTVSDTLEGTYSCFAENSLGTASQTFMITGTPMPTPVPGGCRRTLSSVLFATTMLLSSLLVLYN